MIPAYSFETERLILKPTDEEDASFIFYLMNTPKWLKYIGNRNITSVAKAKDYIHQRILPQLKKLGFGNFTIIRKEDHKKIGTCGLFQREGLNNLDIGFAFLPRYEQQGYAFEAASKLLKAGFEQFGLEKIVAITTIDNLASQKLLYKLGLHQTKMIRLPNDPEELCLFEIHKHEKQPSPELKLT